MKIQIIESERESENIKNKITTKQPYTEGKKNNNNEMQYYY